MKIIWGGKEDSFGRGYDADSLKVEESQDKTVADRVTGK